MAYNFYPAYQYGNPYQMIQNQQSQQMQSSGLVSVRNRAEAENYPVAPGNSVTFKDETAPFIYVKSMGFSQLDRPTFEAFRLVKEDTPQTAQNSPESGPEVSKADLTLYAEKRTVDALEARIEALEANQPRKARKKDGDDDG